MNSTHLPIGQFAQLCRLSIKALRHYDEIGLLEPAHIDPTTNYRYYTLDQAAKAEQIRVLRALEVPLAEIKALVALRDPASVQSALEQHRARLALKAQEYQDLLITLEELIAEAGTLPLAEIVVKEVPAVPVLAKRMQIDPGELPTAGKSTFRELYGALEGRWDALLGPPFSIQFDETRMDLEYCIPIADAPVLADAGPREVAGARVACLMHVGPSLTLGISYRRLFRWITEQGLTIAGPAREVYIKNPGNTPEPRERLTELQWPVG